MLTHEVRCAILALSEKGHGTRFIARSIGISRRAVQQVVASGQTDVPTQSRAGQLDGVLDEVRALYLDCSGNMVRVHEELRARHGIVVPYSSLTRFCRNHAISVKRKKASGRYTFEPGEEMQHDTSPHLVKVGGCKVKLQCASLVMCYSRRRYIQCYRRWTRFHVRAFLTRALGFFEGSANRCMLDNSTVIMTGGTGPDARAVPEMQAFSDRFGFTFAAHFIGDANRSARVEAPFFHVENNFYAGRTFADLDDLNSQAVQWCRAYNSSFHKSFGGIPDELGVVERLAGKPLPAYIPEPTDVHQRRVGADGYVTLHTNRYSVPEQRIGQAVEVHETLARVRVFSGHHLLAEHARLQHGATARSTTEAHRHRRPRKTDPRRPSDEERALRAAGPVLGALCDALIENTRTSAARIRRLHRIWVDYPSVAVEPAVERALEFGLLDLPRIERMVLKRLHGEFFRLPKESSDG